MIYEFHHECLHGCKMAPSKQVNVPCIFLTSDDKSNEGDEQVERQTTVVACLSKLHNGLRAIYE